MKKILIGLTAMAIAMLVYTNVTAPKRESAPVASVTRVEKHQTKKVAMVRENESVAPVAPTEEVVGTNEAGPYHVRMEGVQVELVPSRKQ